MAHISRRMKSDQNRVQWRLWVLPQIALALCVCRSLTGENAQPKISQAQLNDFKIMNYYPIALAGPSMWVQWDPNVLKTDFSKMASMHVNVVRLCFMPGAVGYPHPSPAMMDELKAAVGMAAQKGLRVQLTLFFMWHDYADIEGSKIWAKGVLEPFAHDSRIAFVELHNEIPQQDEAAMSWSRTMLPYLRTVLDNSVPVTVSVTGDLTTTFPELISALGASQPDFYDVHLYNYAPYAAYYQLKAAKDAATAKGRPIIIGETGSPTIPSHFGGFRSFPKTQVSIEAWQDYYYRLNLLASQALGLPPASPWILFDYAPGTLPGRPNDGEPYHFGLYHADGTAKAAAATVSTFFGSGSVDTSFNNGFERYDMWDGHNQPELWVGDTPTQATYEDDITVSHSGCCSAKIANSGSSTQNPGLYITPVANIEPGSSHTASVWVKGRDATGTTQICIGWLRHGPAVYRPAVPDALSCAGSLSGTTSSWHQISVTSVAPAWTAAARIYLQSGHNTGVAWFDDVTFQ